MKFGLELDTDIHIQYTVADTFDRDYRRFVHTLKAQFESMLLFEVEVPFDYAVTVASLWEVWKFLRSLQPYTFRNP